MSGLVVVDMQPKFKASEHPDTFENVRKLINQFRKDEKPIFFVEYRNNGQTHDRLLYGMYRYEQAYWIRKDRDDGSKWLHSLITRVNLGLQDLVVCGVNASFCVSETVQGLIGKGYNVVVPEGATCNAPDQIEDYGLEGSGTMEWLAGRFPEKFKLHPVIELLSEGPAKVGNFSGLVTSTEKVK